jgi:16S rRNA (cytosine967-C5)-methyltransferase
MNPGGAQVRAVAADVLDAVVNRGQSLDAALIANEPRVAAVDCPLLRMLCYGSLRHHWRLQSWIDQLVSKPLRKRDRIINALLAVGLYQMAEMRIPDHAVVSETVAAARVLNRPKLAGLVNACLRRFGRENLATAAPLDDQSRWNHPAWLVRRLQQDWPDDWQAILSANDQRAPMWLRANPSRNTAQEYCERLAAVGFDADTIAGIPDAVRLSKAHPVNDLPGFAAGDASVQDAAAQLAARWLWQRLPQDKTPLRVLDACAAPGGKSGHLLELGGDRMELFAVDEDALRIQGIAENLDRIGRHATIIAADASNPELWWDRKPFDGILLDAPCSASGVIRRHPDIKLLRREADLPTLAARQSALLDALWPLLAPGGCLLYATCSVLSAENDEVTGFFLNSHEDALENDVLPNYNIRDLMRKKACGYQVLPGSAGLDGFYYAALQKTKVS